MIGRAVILSTGDELITGKVVDTNSTDIAGRLFSAGIEVAAVLKVGDDKDRLIWALGQARELGDIVIGTGGLGPTADDLTTRTIADFLGCPVEMDEQVARQLRQHFKERGLVWLDNSNRQATFPAGSTVIPNSLGTAPGFRTAIGPGKTLFWLSGVPREMSVMLEQSVLPWLERQSEGSVNFSCTFKIHGLSEGQLDDQLRSIGLDADARLSFRSHFPDLSLTLSFRGRAPESRISFEKLRERIEKTLHGYIYAEGDTTLEEVVGRLLLQQGRTLALAESCTGGYISHRITRVAGSSAYYYGGLVTYSNEAKTRFLGVRPETLSEHGAVSRETALEMSAGIRQRTGASVGLGITGIAGPGGGGPEKPVGTVWLSLARDKRHEAKLLKLAGDRERIILAASQAALSWLRSSLLE